MATPVAGPAAEELSVTAVVAGGDGLARTPDGRVVLVEGGLPGERVLVGINETHRDYLRAVVTGVVAPSPDRTVPPCPHVGAGCGGCPWQHIAAAAQLRLKCDIVADALRRIAHLPGAEVTPAGAIGPTGYRTTVRMAVGADGRPAYRRRRDPGLVAVDSCLVAHPRIQELILTGRYPGAEEVTFRVSAATGEHLILRRPGPRADARRSITERVGGRDWRVSATSFFQSGPAAAGLLLDTVDAAVADALTAGGRLVDLYAGVGLLGGGLAARRRAVLTAVERHPASAADARVNLAGLDARVVQVDVQQWRPPSEGPVDVLLADPARAGLGRRDAAALLQAAPGTIILVSCDPASLARDAVLLAAGGYALRDVRVIDLFPHTVHVETVARFDRGGSAGQDVLDGGQQLGCLGVGEGAEAGDDVA